MTYIGEDGFWPKILAQSSVEGPAMVWVLSGLAIECKMAQVRLVENMLLISSGEGHQAAGRHDRLAKCSSALLGEENIIETVLTHSATPPILAAWQAVVEALPMDQITLLRLAKVSLGLLKRLNSASLARAALVIVSRTKVVIS